jgi:lipopolysaccharide transport system ATP-binding protein
MKTRNRITLRHVDLCYPSIGFKERSLKSALANLFNGKRKAAPIRDIIALKNICLDIRPGEKVGLIGHNGAGKTTLLKTIAGLYPISAGEILISGKIRALFDLSLGFEPDATGRENILYRGLLLGLNPKQIRRIEDEIVDFAGLGEFIDYPIKTYSAGMLVRLAFAISTAVGGDILLLDEIIGAGDASFMQKAKERINRLIAGAEILVLASHDFGALQAICSRGVVLQKGQIVFDGPIAEAISAYRKSSHVAC